MSLSLYPTPGWFGAPRRVALPIRYFLTSCEALLLLGECGLSCIYINLSLYLIRFVSDDMTFWILVMSAVRSQCRAPKRNSETVYNKAVVLISAGAILRPFHPCSTNPLLICLLLQHLPPFNSLHIIKKTHTSNSLFFLFFFSLWSTHYARTQSSLNQQAKKPRFPSYDD